MKFRPRIALWLEIAIAVLVALALSNAATFLLFRLDGDRRMAPFAPESQTKRLAHVAGIVVRTPEASRPDLLQAISSPGMMLTIDTGPIVPETAQRNSEIEALIGDATGGAVARVTRPPEPMTASVALAQGRWLNARTGPFAMRAPPSTFISATGVVLGSLLLVSLWIGGRVTRPLQRLAEAAGALRRGELRTAVPETGPTPVREAAQAFNAMSERVLTMLKSQRAMMAAVAHDLRTPIAVLRFRAELVSDEETRAKLVETINEMQGMTEAVLAAVRLDGAGEAARQIDLGALIESLVVDMAEVGGDVAYQSQSSVVCVCRAAEVRRAVRNLIENALRYGVRARVSIEASNGAAAIHVDDDGPGIPEGEHERVFEPFARLDESRNRDTGGSGLGLAIARLIARGHGGDVKLLNRTGGGLRATLTLPLE